MALNQANPRSFSGLGPRLIGGGRVFTIRQLYEVTRHGSLFTLMTRRKLPLELDGCGAGSLLSMASWSHMRGLCSTGATTLCLAISLAFPPALAQHSLPRSVLILDESGPGALNPGYAEITRSFRSNLLSQSPAHIYIQNLDLNNFSGTRYQTKLQEYLRDKYHDVPIGVLLAVGSSAFQFALQLRSESWSNVPIVFASADEESVTRIVGAAGARNVT